ncbi:MAG TPA: hypothetical protein VNO52_03485 [Methylomirabilota bacterium]|nr:hypothetical protein [Methylomirabilota bacterium]
MNASLTRRGFLRAVGGGVFIATLGSELAVELGLATPLDESLPDALRFGDLEPLVSFMQETPVTRLQPALVEKLRAGVALDRLVAAAALANARTFGGEDYTGYHTLMALGPALRMARCLPGPEQPLPVFKVLYRNTSRIQENGGRKAEVLRRVEPTATPASAGLEVVRDAVRRQAPAEVERLLAGLIQRDTDAAFQALLVAVQEDTEVHRTVLPYRAWDLLDVVGREHADALLRQSLRYCLRAEKYRTSRWDKHSEVLVRLLDEHKLLGREPGRREADDAFVEKLSDTIFSGSPEEAAAAAAAALAEGFRPSDVGEAITLAANQLVLRDRGRPPSMEQPGKPVGSVHGDSIGVHASDAANAWRNLARVSRGRNTYACLILGAWQAALDRTNRGGDFLNWEPLPIQRHVNGLASTDGALLLRELDIAIRGNLQAQAAAIVHRLGQIGHPEAEVFQLLLRFAVSEDGALHAEKYFQTVWEEFHTTRPAFRWRHLIALARVTASEFGRPAPGQAEARELLRV